METEKLIERLQNHDGVWCSILTGAKLIADTAITLEQLQAENDRLKKEVQQMRWIPVEEKLPEKSGEYLVFTEESDIFGMDFDEDVGENGEFGLWFPRFSQGGYVDSNWEKAENVTHWMPLPKPPKEED